MPERFLVRTQGGPRPGTRVTDGWTWPLPDLLLAEDGCYVKKQESDLPPQPEGSRLMRGAEYEWQPGDATAEQLSKAISTAIKTHRLEEVSGLLHLLALQDPDAAALVYDLVTAIGAHTDA